MKKIVKFLSLIAIILIMGVSLTSCAYDFYGDFNENGAEITENDNFKFQPVTVEDVKGYRDSKKSFILFVGNATNSSCVSNIKKIDEEATNLNYKGIILYLDVQEILKSLSQHEETEKTLNVKSIDDANYGIVAVCYDEGNVKWETSNTNKYGPDLKKFADGSDNLTTNISFRAITDYMIERYSIESLEKF